MVVTSSALVLATLAGVARVVLGAGVGYLHDHTRSVASAVATAIVLASNLEPSATHSCWAGRAFTLADVCVPAVITVALGASWVRGIVLSAAANTTNPEL